MPTRDFVAEMRAVIDAETQGAYIPRQVADRIVAKLAATDPELLDGWLHAQAEQIIWQHINDRDRSTRAHSKQVAGRAAFGAASGRHADGDPQAMTEFLGMPITVDGVRKPLSMLTGPELLTVAGDYDARAARNAMTAAFVRALGRKVESGTVADHFTETELAALWRSLARR